MSQTKKPSSQKREEGKIEFTFMCAKCTEKDKMSVYDSHCQTCDAPNPYYEDVKKPPTPQHWFCSRKECHTLNVLPSLECRICLKYDKKAKAKEDRINKEALDKLKSENFIPELKPH